MLNSLKTRTRLALAAVTVGLACSALAQNAGVSYSVGAGSPVGLWDSTGATQLTSAVNLSSASFELQYQTILQNLTLPNTVTYQRRSVDAMGNKIWPLFIRLNFDSNQWVNHPNAAIGINVASYMENYYSNGSKSVTGPLDYFQLPQANSFVPSSALSGYTAATSYTQVNPRLFTLSQFTPDLAYDSTGKSAVATFYVVEGAPSSGLGYPYNDTPSTTIATVYGGNPNQTFRGVIWLFPRVGQAGRHNYLSTPQPGYPYGSGGPGVPGGPARS